MRHGNPRPPPRPRWMRPPPLPDADEVALIEQLRSRGTTLNAGTWWEAGKPGRTNLCLYIHACSMRTAEALSRNADRKASTWFNDDMLAYWRSRWFENDRLRNFTAEQFAAWQREQLDARETDPEERAVLEQEWTAWERQQQIRERERAAREARWSAEERAWYAEEEAAKQQRLAAARATREQQRDADRANRRAQRDLTQLGSLIRRTEHHARRHPNNSRYPRENAQTLESPGRE